MNDTGVKCYWLERIDRARLYLRRYATTPGVPCAAGDYHNGMAPLSEVGEWYVGEDTRRVLEHDGPQRRSDVPADAPWPVKCDSCDYAFQEADEWQIFCETLYKRADTGQVLERDEFTPGAMWNAEYLTDNPFYRGPDGRSLIVILPNGNEWTIDGPCRNCTKPDDSNHKCWCRHGDPPNLTVDKNCSSCDAGAGSILSGDYHGFLRNGIFEP